MFWALWAFACNQPAEPKALPFALTEAGPAFAGFIAEQLDAGSYTYSLIRQGESEHWVVSITAPPLGAAVTIKPFGVAHGFSSKRTGRTFDQLTFASVTIQEPS